MTEPENRRGPWISTFSGRRYYPIDPRADEIHLIDIAHSLSNTCRYNGHSRLFYSVAEHSILLARYVLDNGIETFHHNIKSLASWALLHDAQEAYLGDLPQPLKHGTDMGILFQIKEELNVKTVAQRFHLLGPKTPHPIDEFDRRILLDEKDALFVGAPLWSDLAGVKPLGVELTFMQPMEAKARFLQMAEELEIK